MPRDRGQVGTKPDRAYRKVSRSRSSRQASLSSALPYNNHTPESTMLCASESLLLNCLYIENDSDGNSA